VPAKDRYHDAVKRALVKAGWEIIRDQYPIRIGDKRIWIDFSAEEADGSTAAFFEVKDFHNSQSVQLLRDAVGQYVLYRAAMRHAKLGAYPLFLAVPQLVFDEMLSCPVGRLVIEDVEMNLLIFDPIKESIAQWLPFTK